MTLASEKTLLEVSSTGALITCAGSLNLIAPSDTTDTTALTTKGLHVVTAGDLFVRDVTHPGVTIGPYAVFAGDELPWNVSRVMAATTAVVLGMA